MILRWTRYVRRQIVRHPRYYAITTVGLAVAMATTFLIGLYLFEELRYDQHHDDLDRIHVLTLHTDFFGGIANSSFAARAELESSSPRVETAAAVKTNHSVKVRALEDSQMASSSPERVEMESIRTEPSITDILNLPTRRGDLAEALQSPNGTALTVSAAQQLFGTDDVLGRDIEIKDVYENDPVVHTVRAVVEDAPPTSTLTYALILPFTEKEKDTTAWGQLMYRTYVKLNASMTAEAASEHVNKVLSAASDGNYTFASVPLASFYLSDYFEKVGFRADKQYIYIFGLAALLVLLVACVNYVNLATLHGQRRAREIAVRKAVGAGRTSLAGQFIGESVAAANIASVLGIGLASLTLPTFNTVMSTDLGMLDAGWTGIAAVLGVGLLVGVVAGAYPGLVISQFQPSTIFQNNSRTSTGGGGWIHRGLVVIQFSISVLLIASTAVIYLQLDYVQNKNLGFEGEQVAYVSLSRDAADRSAVVRSRMKSFSGSEAVTAASAVPGQFSVRFGLNASSLSAEHGREDGDARVRLAMALVDEQYTDVLSIEVIAGRAFNKERESDRTQAVMLTEMAAQEMGWTAETAIGKPFSISDTESTVIGVVRDFHAESLQMEMMPIVLQMHTTGNWSSEARHIAVRLAPDQIGDGVDALQEAVSEAVPGANAEVTFLDDAFNEAYQSEERLAWLFGALAFIAILVSCLGLYGLIGHAVERRTKEIGIRRALGATVSHIISLMTRQYVLLVGVAFVVASPIAYMLMQEWLNGFAYRIDLGVRPFLVSGILALIIALIGMSSQAYHAICLDPARSLRNE